MPDYPPPEFFVYRVNLPDGVTDIISLLPDTVVFQAGLPPDAIVGRCVELVGDGVAITEANFQANGRFVDLLHEVIATTAPTLPELQAEARRQQTGRLYIIDARTRTPDGDVPPHDILGRFSVSDGVVADGSYEANANHKLFSSDGWFQLDPRIHQALVSRLTTASSGT